MKRTLLAAAYVISVVVSVQLTFQLVWSFLYWDTLYFCLGGDPEPCSTYQIDSYRGYLLVRKDKPGPGIPAARFRWDRTSIPEEPASPLALNRGDPDSGFSFFGLGFRRGTQWDRMRVESTHPHAFRDILPILAAHEPEWAAFASYWSLIFVCLLPSLVLLVKRFQTRWTATTNDQPPTSDRADGGMNP